MSEGKIPSLLSLGFPRNFLNTPLVYVDVRGGIGFSLREPVPLGSDGHSTSQFCFSFYSLVQAKRLEGAGVGCFSFPAWKWKWSVG